MSKTITINEFPEDRTQPRTFSVDVLSFVTFTDRLRATPDARLAYPTAWLSVGLLVHDNENRVTITPRGEDLLASTHLIPDDPEPVKPGAPTCEACNGTGEQLLFTSTHTCDVCQGSKVQPTALTHNPCASMSRLSPYVITVNGEKRMLDMLRLDPPYSQRFMDEIYRSRPYEIRATSGRTSSKRPSEHPWMLIDSEEVAQSFVGKRVEIDAQAVRDWWQHGKHATVLSLEHADDDTLYFADDADIDWLRRGNVRLRVVGDSNV